MSDLSGSTVAGYPIQKLLNKGSYVEVYQAASSGAPVAVRVLRADLRSNASLGSSIVKGWEAARLITHTNLITAYSTGTDPQAGPFALEECIAGKSLRQMMLGGPKVAWRDCLILAEQLFAALAALHQAGKCHGDIWSGNIVLTQDQDLKLEGAGGLTQIGSSPTDILEGPAVGYLAPEVLQGSPITLESDLYSCGAVLHFILSGQDAFAGEDGAVIARAAIERKAPPLSASRDDIPPEAEAFIGRLMAKDPTQRYGLVADVLADIGRLKAGQPMAPLKGGRPAAPPVVKAPPKAAETHPSKDSRSSSGSGLKSAEPGRSSAGFLAAVKSGGGPARVFGRLETHVKSTIPQSDTEKRGDDYYRQGQLPLALNSWKEAFGASPHAALKIKVELGERELKKEAFDSALEEARHRLTIGDTKGAVARAREAILAAETDQQRQEAVRVETEANQSAQSAAKSGTIKIAAAAIGFIVFVFLVFKLLGGKSEDSSTPSDDHEGITRKVPVFPSGPPDKDKMDDGRYSVPVAKSTVMIKPPWTNRGGDLVALDGADNIVVKMIVTSVTGIHAAKLAQLRGGTEMKSPTKLQDMECCMFADGVYQISELGFRHMVNNQPSIRYYYVINGPADHVYIAQFDGAEAAFSPPLRTQVHQIIQSWSYKKK